MIAVWIAAQVMIVTPLPGGGWDVSPQIVGQERRMIVEPVPGGYVMRPAIIPPVVVDEPPVFDLRTRRWRWEPEAGDEPQ
jgi:hypothetical protein